jgi:hypothetical protein
MAGDDRGVKYQIVDIGMRMLQPHELYKAQGFPDGYVIDQDYRGNRYAKDKQVARCGNAVPPPFAVRGGKSSGTVCCNSRRWHETCAPVPSEREHLLARP